MHEYINLDKPALWKNDVISSVDFYNKWFLKFAPAAYRDERKKAIEYVLRAFDLTKNLAVINAKILISNPGILPSLRMSTCPPIARDRLSGLSKVSKTIIQSVEKGHLPTRITENSLQIELKKISDIICCMLDSELLPWIVENRRPTKLESERGATVIADRLCGAQADPIIRNAQEERQLNILSAWLKKRGYKKIQSLAMENSITEMPPATFAFRMNILVGKTQNIRIPVDVVVQPKKLKKDRLPILIEAKSAGDFTNTNKRRKEEAQKFQQLRTRFGDGISYILFLCGYFDSGYLGYEAAEGIDWIWEHRMTDLEKLGL